MDYDYEESEDARTIYCGNLASKVTEELLYELFLQAGPLERVFIPTDRDGRLVSYGFITYKHSCSVNYALNLFDGVQLYNCKLNMKPRTRQDNSAPNSPQFAGKIPIQQHQPMMNSMSPNHQLMPLTLTPVQNNQNRTPSGRNEHYRNNEHFRNESLQGRFSNYPSKRDRDKMRPNDNHRHYNKKHKR